MKTARLTTLKTLAATITLTLGSSLAQAGHYGEIDDHAREIYYDAGRADRVVRYNFRSAPLPVYTCLRENLCGMVETAACVNDLTRRSGNLDLIQEHIETLDDQFTEVKKGTESLRKWIAQCPPPRIGRYGSCSASRSSLDEFNLRRLCDRVEEIGEEVDCMLKDLDKLLVDAGIDAGHHNRGPHSHGGRLDDHRDRGPVSPQRLNVPPTPSRGLDHQGRGRHLPNRAVQVPIFRHNGQSFSLSLRF